MPWRCAHRPRRPDGPHGRAPIHGGFPAHKPRTHRSIPCCTKVQAGPVHDRIGASASRDISCAFGGFPFLFLLRDCSATKRHWPGAETLFPELYESSDCLSNDVRLVNSSGCEESRGLYGAVQDIAKQVSPRESAGRSGVLVDLFAYFGDKFKPAFFSRQAHRDGDEFFD